MLLSNGCDANSFNKHTKMTALHWACTYNEPNSIIRLLRHGAKQNLYDYKNRLPIDIAGEMQNYSVSF